MGIGPKESTTDKLEEINLTLLTKDPSLCFIEGSPLKVKCNCRDSCINSEECSELEKEEQPDVKRLMSELIAKKPRTKTEFKTIALNYMTTDYYKGIDLISILLDKKIIEIKSNKICWTEN